jgi:hypothetical protein
MAFVAPVAPELVVVLVLVPGGKTGLGAVLGELFSPCANAAEVEISKAIPKKTLANRVGRMFIVRDSVLNRDRRSSLMVFQSTDEVSQS